MTNEPREKWLTAAALACVVFGLNYYICRELFSLSSSGRTNAMHGFWMTLAQRGISDMLSGPLWWPYWDGGMPAEYTYAPLFPLLIAAISKLSGLSEGRSFHILLGSVYCLGPVTLFLAVWRLARRLGLALCAATLYSLTSLALLFAPNGPYRISSALQPERLYLVSAWDEAPHLLALSIWPLAVLALHRCSEARTPLRILVAASLGAAMVHASAFGTTVLTITASALLFTFSGRNWKAILYAGLLTMLMSASSMPPSLLRLITEASNLYGHGWTARSWTTLCVCLLILCVLHTVLSRWNVQENVRLLAYLTATAVFIVSAQHYLTRNFFPQPERYKNELSVILAVALGVALVVLSEKCPVLVRVGLCLAAVAACVENTIEYRSWAKQYLKENSVDQSIERRAMLAADRFVHPAARIFLPGSIAMWGNLFSRHSQFGGASWATAPNPMLQRVQRALFNETGVPSGSLVWFRVFGIGGVVVSGPNSPEFWKPFKDPLKYRGVLEAVWSEEDTTLYRVPWDQKTLAHAVPCDRKPSIEWEKVLRYVDAIEHSPDSDLEAAFASSNHIKLSGPMPVEKCVSLQINYHPGWTATVGEKPVELQSDGLGLIWIDRPCAGPCSIQLRYDGGTELRLCRFLTAVSSSLVFTYFFYYFAMRPLLQKRKRGNIPL